MTTYPYISTVIDTIIDYKFGRIDLDEAIYQFCAETGLDEKVARRFLMGISRDNVVPIHKLKT